jgi:Flp pilus assembly protein TadD
LSAYEAASRADPSDETVRYSYAEALLAAGSREEAFEMLQALSRAQSVEVLASSARLLGRMKEFSLCITTLDRAIGIQSAPELYVDRGLCKHGKKDEPAARSDFEAAIAKDGSFAPAHYYLGMHLLGIGKKAEARAALARAVEVAGGTSVGQAAQRALDEL